MTERLRSKQKVNTEENTATALSTRGVARMLKKARLGNKAPLLERENEFEFLDEIVRWVRSLPVGTMDCVRQAQEISLFKGRVRALCHHYDFDLTLIPSRQLYGIYGVAPERHGSGRAMRMTLLGEALKATVLNQDNAFAFLIDGAAAQACEIQPVGKRRPKDRWKSLHPGQVDPRAASTHSAADHFWDTTLYAPPPETDADVLLVGLTPEALFDRLWKFSAVMRLSGVLKIHSSERRECRWLDICIPGYLDDLGLYGVKHRPAKSIAQIAPPELLGKYSGDFSFLCQILSRMDNPPPVLLISLTDGSTVGVAMNGFPNTSLYRKLQVTDPVQRQVRELTPTVAQISELAFPAGWSMAEGFYHANHLLRAAAWADQVHFLKRGVLEECFRWNPANHRQKIAELSRMFSEWMAEKVYHRVAADPTLLGDEDQIAENGADLVCRTLPEAFRGDPGITALRCLVAGELDNALIPVGGWGICDPRGPLSNLGLLFSDPEIRKHFLDRMFKAEQGPVGDGWKVFIDFLFEQFATYEPIVAAQYVAFCLTPFKLDYLKFAQKYLVYLDRRFKVFLKEERRVQTQELPRRGSVAFGLLSWFYQNPNQRYSESELEQDTGIDKRLIRAALAKLEVQGFLQRQQAQSRLARFAATVGDLRGGQTKSTKDGSYIRWREKKRSWILFKSPGTDTTAIFAYLARPEVLTVGATLRDIYKHTGLSPNNLRLTIKYLKGEGIVERVPARDNTVYRINPKWTIETIPI